MKLILLWLWVKYCLYSFINTFPSLRLEDVFHVKASINIYQISTHGALWLLLGSPRPV